VVFRTGVTEFDEPTGGVRVQLPPPLVQVLKDCYDGLPLVDEGGKPLGKTKIVYGDRWMFLPFPPEVAWRQRISMDEIVDADGDGRRTLRLIAANKVGRWHGPERPIEVLQPGTRMCDLEVTRVTDDGTMLWFRNPKEQFVYTYPIPHDSWFYQGMDLATEDGKRRLTANYPGWDLCITARAGG